MNLISRTALTIVMLAGVFGFAGASSHCQAARTAKQVFSVHVPGSVTTTTLKNGIDNATTGLRVTGTTMVEVIVERPSPPTALGNAIRRDRVSTATESVVIRTTVSEDEVTNPTFHPTVITIVPVW